MTLMIIGQHNITFILPLSSIHYFFIPPLSNTPILIFIDKDKDLCVQRDSDQLKRKLLGIQGGRAVQEAIF